MPSTERIEEGEVIGRDNTWHAFYETAYQNRSAFPYGSIAALDAGFAFGIVESVNVYLAKTTSLRFIAD